MAARRYGRSSTGPLRRVFESLQGLLSAVPPAMGAGAALCVIILGVVFWRGCGGSGSGDLYGKWGGMSEEEWKKERAEADRKEAAELAKGLREAEAAKKEREKRMAEAKRRPAGQKTVAAPHQPAKSLPRPGAPEPPPLPQLPAEFSTWTDRDFQTARLLGDPRLVLAVEYRTSHPVDKAKDAQLFAQLLAPPVTAMLKPRADGEAIAPPRGTRRGATPAKALIEAIATGLATHQLPASHKALEAMVAGTQKTEDDRAAAEAALGQLARNPSVEHEAVLMRALVAPNHLRPPGQGQVTAADLQRMALAAVGTGASARFRAGLAALLVEPATHADLRRLLLPMLLENRPENLQAHSILYQSSVLEPGPKATIEKELADYGAEAVAKCLGLRSGPALPGADPAWSAEVARQLWNSQFLAGLDNRSRAVKSLAEGAPVMLLAGTIPLNAARRQLHRTLLLHWQDGPATLRSAGLGTTIQPEPGLVVVLKRVAEQVRADQRVTMRKVSIDRKEETRQHLKERQERRQQVLKDWREFGEDLLKAQCERLFAASASQAADAAPAPASAGAERARLFELPPKTRSLAALHRSWGGTGGSPGDSAPVDPFEIHYLRLEGVSSIDRVAAYYRRMLGTAEVHSSDSRAWLDDLAADARTDRLRSIDVLIEAAKSGSDKLPSEEQPLVVEILAIDIAQF